MTDFPAPEFVTTNGIRLAVRRAGPTPGAGRATVVLLHGFPELAWSWRHQIPVLADAGFSVIAPDMRGYGDSDAPAGQDAYRMAELSADCAGLLDHYGFETAYFVGHDWGALVLWALPFHHPARVAGLCGLNVPFIPRGPVPPTEAFRAAFGPDMYILRFQEEGACEPILERDVDRTMRFFMRAPNPGSAQGGGAFSTPDLDLIRWLEGPEKAWPGRPFLSEDAFEVFIDAFRRSGFTAPLHYYRNMDANWRDMARFQPDGVPPAPLPMPTLMITAELDGVVPPRLARGMEAFFSDYERIDITDCGHWTQQEKPAEVNAALLDWLARKAG